MIEYLKQLIKSEQWEAALTYAEQLTSKGNQTTEQVVDIYCALALARFKVGDYAGALMAGEVAASLSAQVDDWESFAVASNSLGAAHIMLKQYEQAETCLRAYIDRTPLFKRNPRRDSNVWFNLSLALKYLGRGSEAIEALKSALGSAVLTQDERRMSALTLTLVDACLKAGQVEPIPRLLAQSGRYFRNQAATAESLLYHLVFRTEFALLTGRHFRARTLALRGLDLATGHPRHQFSFHLLLARVALTTACKTEAVDHGMAARTYAHACQRPDLEAEASVFLEGLLGDRGTSVG